MPTTAQRSRSRRSCSAAGVRNQIDVPRAHEWDTTGYRFFFGRESIGRRIDLRRSLTCLGVALGCVAGALFGGVLTGGDDLALGGDSRRDGLTSRSSTRLRDSHFFGLRVLTVSPRGRRATGAGAAPRVCFCRAPTDER